MLYCSYAGSSTADLVFIMVVACYTMMSLCTAQYIQQSSGVLVVFVASITVSRLANPKISVDIAQGLKGIWVFAEVLLFTLSGVSLALSDNNGPLYGGRGLSADSIAKLLGVMFASSAARFGSLGLVCLLVYRNLPPHRQNWRWLLPYWINCYIYQLPKATVQATMGGVAYSQHIIPGAVGLNTGMVIEPSRC